MCKLFPASSDVNDTRLMNLQLAVDFFAQQRYPEDIKHKQLVKSLEVMINLVGENGALLVIDIEKCDRLLQRCGYVLSRLSP